jgi:peptidoglycan/LPS O-acetylase OafA/YrhL
MRIKEHFLTLDFLRGVAALGVMEFHWLSQQGYTAFGLGHLAVDFFFVLSGFVIAYSYEERLKSTMTAWRFAVVRLVRLYPMILIAIALGVFRAVARGHAAPEFAVNPVVLATAVVANLAMIPADFSKVGLNDFLFPLNGVLWSLFFELVANFAYAIIVRWLGMRLLLGLIAAGFAAICFFVVRQHSMDFGFSVADWLGGAARVTFSFFVGVLLYRLRNEFPILRKPSAGALTLGVILALVLALPGHGTAAIEFVMVVIGFPLFVILGANHVPTGFMAKVAATFGALSYPFYAIHWPLLWIVTGVLKFAHVYANIDPAWMAIPVTVGIGAFAWAILKLYDEPVRAWLTRRFLARPIALKPQVIGATVDR